MSKVRYGAYSLPGRKYPDQSPNYTEDRVVVNDEMQFAAVFDGHGGARCAEFCSQNASELFQHALDNRLNFGSEFSGGSSEDAVFTAVAGAFMECFSALETEYKECSLGTGDTSGTCTLMTCIYENECYIANLGDCRAIYKKNWEEKTSMFKKSTNEVVQATEDHRVTSEEEVHRCLEAGGRIENGRIGTLIPSRTLGDFDVKSVLGDQIITALPDITSFEIDAPTLLIFGSDGLFDGLSNKKVMEFTQKLIKANPEDLDSAASALAQLASQHSKDDITVVVVSMEP